MESQPQVDVVEKNAISQGLTIKNAFLFLVDWRRVMLKHRLYISESSETHQPMLSVVLTSIADIMKNKIKEASTDVFGIYAFGASSAEESVWPRMNYIHQLQKLDAEGIKKIQKMAQHAARAGNSDNIEEALKSDNQLCAFGTDEPVEFNRVIQAARNKLEPFAKSAMAVSDKSLYRLRVIVLTGDEDPTTKTPEALRKAQTEAKDLIGAMSVAIDVMLFNDASVPVPDNYDDIDTEKAFFDQLVQGGDDEISYTQGTVIRGLNSSDDIIERFTWRTRSKRAVLRTTLTLGDGYTFGVAAYLLISQPRKPTRVELFAETNEPIKRITSATCELIGKVLLPDEIRYAYKYPFLKSLSASGEIVYGFSKDEIAQMSVIGPRGIHLYGFKKRSEFKMEHVYKTPYFLHPNDSAYKGSSEIFTQLLYSMLKNDVIGIVKTALRKTEQTRFAALVPQDEKRDENDRVIQPVGFFMFALPFKNDLRHTWRKELPAPLGRAAKKEEEIGAVNGMDTKMDMVMDRVPIGTETARKFVRKLTKKNYHPRDYADPSYAKFYEVLESHAGISTSNDRKDEEEEAADKFAEFAIHPKVAMMDERQGANLRRFKEETMGEYFDGAAAAEMFGTKTGKRAREAEDKARVKREKKAENMEIAQKNLHIEIYIDAYNNNDLNAFKKSELVTYMNAFGLEYAEGTRKLKKDALEAVAEHLKGYIAGKK